MPCDFTYYTPTKLLFGKGALYRLPALVSPYGKKLLIVYGGGSIKKSGIYDHMRAAFVGFDLVDFGGVAPNPKYEENVKAGIAVCKREQVDAVLAVGGGSVVDCAKSICAGAFYAGEPWDIISGKVRAERVLPLFVVLTLSATGSEFNNGSVISRPQSHDKLCFKDDRLCPVASVLDPDYTCTVSGRQTAAGIVDGISHVLEQYFCGESSLLTDGMCEATIRCLMDNVPRVMKNPADEKARGEIMLCCTLACNGILSIGNAPSGWPCHAIEHALSGFYDIVHGEGLAIVTPAWMRYILSNETLPRFVAYGKHVWGINDLSDAEIAAQSIARTEEFFASLGMPKRLEDVGIGTDRLDDMAQHIAQTEGLERAWVPLSEQDVLQILRDCL